MKKAIIILLVSVTMPLIGGCGVSSGKGKLGITDKHGRTWPECVPPEVTNLDITSSSTAGSVNGVNYKCSSKGLWVIDEEAEKAKEEFEAAQSTLLHDLGTRKLTHAELMRVNDSLNIFNKQVYFACEKYADLYDLLVKQWELQEGRSLPFQVHLSKTLGEYNRCPQEYDNKRAVDDLIEQLQAASVKKETK